MIKRFKCTSLEFKAELDNFKHQHGDTIKINRIETKPHIYKYEIHYEAGEKETWADIPGYSGDYQASTLGRVRSKFGIRGSWKVLKLCLNPDTNYLTTCLRKNKAGNPIRVHRIIAKTFIKNPKKLPDVGFLNGIKTDCRPSNLFWKERNKRK